MMYTNMASARVRLVSMVVLAFCLSVINPTQQTFNIIRSSPGGHAEVIICIFRREYAQLLLVNRSPASLNCRLPAPLRQQRVDWSKHGYTCRSPPDFHPDIIDVTISMDISPNPGPQQWNDSFRVLYLNTRSLKAFVDSPDDCARKICKISLLQRLVYGEDFDVISPCETWLNSTVLDCEILPCYNIFAGTETAVEEEF